MQKNDQRRILRMPKKLRQMLKFDARPTRRQVTLVRHSKQKRLSKWQRMLVDKRLRIERLVMK